MEEGMMIPLKSNDGVEFNVPKAVAWQSRTIRHMTEEDYANDVIPIPNINAKILAKVIEYCTKQVDASNGSTAIEEGSSSGSTSSKMSDKELSIWEQQFIDAVNQNTLYDLVMAANYLDISKLLALTLGKVAQMIRGKTVEEIRRTFGIKNDYTPEEEAALQENNLWAFD